MVVAAADLFERGQEGIPLCYVSPSLTVYLSEAADGHIAKAAIDAYRAVCSLEKQKLITGTRAPAFTKMEGVVGRDILATHLELMNRRRDQALAIWDGSTQDSWYFTVWGVPPERGRLAASFCKATFPNGVDPEVIFDLATRLASVLPFLSGHAGLTAHFDAEHKTTAFDIIFAWARRFPGLEVEDLNLTIHHVLDAVKGANWLTLVGAKLWERLKQVSGGEISLPSTIGVMPTKNGMLLRAGSTPQLGDRNAATVPELYAAVERALAPLKLTEHPEFAGRFARDSATMKWLYRLSTPDGWRW
jgi:Protein of unknown function (DUF3396)